MHYMDMFDNWEDYQEWYNKTFPHAAELFEKHEKKWKSLHFTSQETIIHPNPEKDSDVPIGDFDLNDIKD